MKNIFLNLEKITISYYSLIVIFLFSVTSRHLIENFVNIDSFFDFWYIHFYLYYFSIFFSISILISFITKQKLLKTFKIIILLSPIVILGPLIDIIYNYFNVIDIKIQYLNYLNDKEIIYRFISFFGFDNKVDLGFKIEVLLTMIIGSYYAYIKTKSYILTIITFFSLYIISFAFISLLFIRDVFLFNIKLEYLYFLFFGFISFIYSFNNNYIMIIIKNIRFERLLHYFFMFFFGLFIYLKSSESININSGGIYIIILLLFSITSAWIFSVITNDIEDYNIDKISNKNRPLIKGTISLKDYKVLGIIFLFLSLFISINISFSYFFLILLFILLYSIYSLPPYKIKRFVLISKLPIAINSLLMVYLGYILFNVKLYEFPHEITLFILLMYGFSIHFIDIKDYYGDKANGIKTLPVLLGLKKSKIVIGLFFIISYFSTYFILSNNYLWYIFILIGLLQYYFINKKEYKEKYVFYTYLLSLLLLIIFTIN